MDLQQTIAELEKQAAQYTEAANALRSLLGQGSTQAVAPKAAATIGTSRKAAKKSTAGKKKQGSRKSAVTDETRAKISAALKASHAARKGQPEASA